MSGREQPRIPNAMDTSREHLDLNRFSQETPFGSQFWDGDRLVTRLNPQDSQRLGMQRQAQAQLLGGLLGGESGAGASAGKPQQPVQPPPMQQAAPPTGMPGPGSGIPPPNPYDPTMAG